LGEEEEREEDLEEDDPNVPIEDVLAAAVPIDDWIPFK